MNITFIGTGFVGLVSAAVFASHGHQVWGLDIDQQKIDKIRQAIVPFYEPGLAELLSQQQASGRLHFTTDYQEAIQNADVIMIAVGTPSAPDGQADLKFVMASAESLAPYLKPEAIVVVKSTVPPGTLPKVKAVIDPLTTHRYYLASVPEFLKEGTAVEDTLHPNRIVIGATEPKVFDILAELHQPFKAPIVKIKPESAQMSKYAANAYLATRITFINQMADLCEKNEADINEVISAISLDQRIGAHYWYPGFGYGGSCFPKDVKEIAAYSREVGEGNNLFNKINELNEARIPRLMDQYEQKLGSWKNKVVAVLGLSFKPNTDDLREAPSTKVIPYLLAAGAKVVGFDPKAKWPDLVEHFTQVDTISEAIQESDVIMALVEWPEIVTFDFAQHKPDKNQWLIDARNQLNAAKLEKAGYHYLGVGI